MSAWAAFWLCCAVFIACDTYLYAKGHDTLLWQHKTPAEMQIQKRQAEGADHDQ